MAPIKIEPISGFPEWLPSSRLAEQRLIGTIQQQFELFGFSPIQTPAVERLKVLCAKGDMQRQIYSLSRPEEDGDEAATSIGLHFDLTVPLARYVVQHSGQLVFPFRRYQIQKVWRGERAQRGRFREFYQCDVDVIGKTTLDPIHDAEFPCIINAAFEAMAAPDFEVHLSNRKILSSLLATQSLGEESSVVVLRAIDKSQRDGMDATKKALREEGIPDVLISPITELIQCESMKDARKLLCDFDADPVGVDELESTINNSVALGMPKSRLKPNFKIARGLDYYTSTVYETFVIGKEEWGSVCSGGRFDDLASYFTPQKYPGVGVSIGLSRLFALLVESEYISVKQQSPTQVLVTMQDRDVYLLDYLSLAKTLRSGGISTEAYLDPHALRDQIGYASSKHIPFAIIAGSVELEHGTVLVKDLERHSQEQVTADELVDYLRRKLQSK